jgi:hypothetical protein
MPPAKATLSQGLDPLSPRPLLDLTRCTMRRPICGSVAAAVAAVLLLTLVGPVQAQSRVSGTVQGTLRDAAGVPVGGALLTLREGSVGVARSFQTGRDGEFEFALLAPGEYELLVEHLDYRPARVLGLQVRPGRRVSIPVTVERTVSAAVTVDTIRVSTALLSGGGAGSGQRLSASSVHGLPVERRELSQALRFSSLAGERLDFEGLPARRVGVMVDGVPVGLEGGALGSAAFAWGALSDAELVSGALDVEVQEGGTILNAYTRHGTRALRVGAFGNWSHGLPEPGVGAGNNLEGGFTLSGSVIPDTASFVVGVEAWRLQAFPSAGWRDGPAAGSIAAVAKDSFGVTLEEPDSPLLHSDVVSGFARFDWQLSGDHALNVRTNFASFPSAAVPAGVARLSGTSIDYQGADLFASVGLASRLSRVLSHETRVSYETTRRDYGPGSAPGLVGPGGRSLSSTLLAAEDAVLGRALSVPENREYSMVRASETVHLRRGAHLLKVGLSGELASYELGGAGREGEFVFSGVDGFARTAGSFVQVVGPARTASFSVPRFAAFAQDVWTVTPGLEVVLGVRYDAERSPHDKTATNAPWLHLSGLNSAAVPATHGRVGPRFGFLWDVQNQHRWLVQGAAGLYTGTVEPGILGEILTHDGGLMIRRGFGTLGRWPLVPDSVRAPVMGPALTLVAPGFAPPRTFRSSFGLSGLLGGGTVLHASSTFRRTDLLPRRTDLNLMPEPVALDQHGRPVYGTLLREGGLLGVENGSNRRFTKFDRVSAINVDGWSRYLGFTVGLEHRAEGAPVGLFASYTVSRTEDNWPSGAGEVPDFQLPSFPNLLDGGDWAEGTSDFDVPHRAVLGLELKLPGSRLGALYRYRSGNPFTPGFRPGVDANGDGSGWNDPAFVDAAIPGMDALVAEWDCLRSQTGRFAARNSCRAAGAHSLDLRFGVSLGRLTERQAVLVVDALNLLASGAGVPDAALLLVDPDAELRSDPQRGTVHVPLIANDAFGRSLAGLASNRALRLGLRVSY